jgi:hypothetical protein
MHGFAWITPVSICFVCIAGLIAVAPWQPRNLNETRRLSRKLTQDRLAALMEYFEPDELRFDDFWRVSGGLRGTFDRLRDLTILVRITQIQIDLGEIAPDERSEIFEPILQQIFYSALSVPEAIICRMWPELPHVATAMAARRHLDATLRLVSLCSRGDYREYAGNLY